MGVGPLPGGSSSLLDITAAAVVKASAGVLVRVAVINGGSAGNLVVNDCATTGAATTANQVLNLAFNALALTAGVPVLFEWPFQAGIVVSAVPTGSQFAISYS